MIGAPNYEGCVRSQISIKKYAAAIDNISRKLYIRRKYNLLFLNHQNYTAYDE